MALGELLNFLRIIPIRVLLRESGRKITNSFSILTHFYFCGLNILFCQIVYRYLPNIFWLKKIQELSGSDRCIAALARLTMQL